MTKTQTPPPIKNPNAANSRFKAPKHHFRRPICIQTGLGWVTWCLGLLNRQFATFGFLMEGGPSHGGFPMKATFLLCGKPFGASFYLKEIINRQL